MKRSNAPFRHGLWAVVLLASVAAASAQEETETADVIGGLAFLERIDVTVVNLDVYVRDKAGRPVTGLQKDDFVLTLDGSPKPITNFVAFSEEVIRAVASEEAPVAAAPAAEPPPAEDLETVEREDLQPVYIVLYVDNENIVPIDRARVLRQVRSFIDQVMLPHVKVMVVSGQRSLQVLQPFTDNPNEVRDALRAMGRLASARVELDRQRNRILNNLQRQSERGVAERGQDQYDQANLFGDIQFYGDQVLQEIDQAVARVREAAYMVAGLPGRKVMVHVSSGLPMVAAKDLVDYAGDIFQRGSTLPMLARFNRRYLYRSLAATANAQGLSLYMIDATGLSGTSTVSAEYARPIDTIVATTRANNMQETLLYLAERTGGRAILDSNDVSVGLGEFKQDLFTYYSLGYSLQASGGDVVHRVDVSVPDHPDYKIVHRRTLIEKSRETQVQDQVATSLSVDIDDNPMAIELAFEQGDPVSEERWSVPVEISVPIESVALVPEGDEYVGRTVVFIATQDADGRQSQVQRRAVDIRFAADGIEERINERYVIEIDLLLRSGPHRFSVGVLDAITRQASYVMANYTVE